MDNWRSATCEQVGCEMKFVVNLGSVAALIYFLIAIYGSYSTCRDAGGVLTMGIGWFVCVEELKTKGNE